MMMLGFGGIFLNSCEKNELDTPIVTASVDKEVSIQNNALHFQSADVFFDISKQLAEMSKEEKDQWEQQLGFTSMRTELNSIFEQLENVETESEMNNLITANSDLIQIIDETIVPIIESDAYASIVNREGIFYVENVIHKIDGQKIASIENGSIEAVTKVLKSNETPTIEGINIVEYNVTNDLKGVCGTSKTAWYNTSNRKCDFKMNTYIYYCSGCCGNTYEQVEVESKIWNYKKSWGKWKSYKTSATMKNRAYTVSVPIVTAFNGVNSVFHYEDVTHYLPTESTTSDWSTMTRTNFIGNQVQNAGIATPSFSRVKGEATNRGIGNNWADILCGSW